MRNRAASLLLLLCGPPAFADTYPRQPAIDIVHYRFAVSFSDGLDHIDGEAVITLRAMSPAEQVELDLVSATNGKGMTVTGVTRGGEAVPFTHVANRLRLPLPRDSAAGSDVTFAIRYAGRPADSLLPRATAYGDSAVFSDNWPDRARQWLPTIDHPYDKATSEMIVTAPAQFQVVSNGTLVEQVDVAPGRRRTHWRQAAPIATWLFAVGVARFDVHHAGQVRGVPLQTWVFPADRDTGRAVFEETSRRAVEFFSDRVGPYPYEKLANVQATGITGGMENATAIFYGEKGVTEGRAPVVHEVAHQWFGNSVTERDWDDVWLSEGFASYFTHLYTEHFEGREAMEADLRASRATIDEVERKMPDTPIVHRNLADMKRVLNGLVYQKGAWVLHMLREEVGLDAFWKGIRAYYARYRDGNASTDDFRQTMEQASGRSLSWFFDQWLKRGGMPQVAGEWRYDAARKAVYVTLTQQPTAAPYRLNVDVALRDAAGVVLKRERLSLSAPSRTYEIGIETAPSDALLDPDVTTLAVLRPLTPSR